MSTSASKMQHWITIQRPGSGKDGAGQLVKAGWSNFAEDWADIRHTGGLEAIRAGAVTSKVNASIRMYYREDLDSGMRIVYGPKIYKIVAVLPDANRLFIDLVAEIVT